MPRVPDEFAMHLFLNTGHAAEVRFKTIQEFQKWYSSKLMPKADSEEFIDVPIQGMEGEYMVVRPKHIAAIRLEPVFTSSVERY